MAGRAKLTTFSCKECYVYRPPPAGSIGHRAEFWDVDHWLQEVCLKVVTCEEECTICLFDQKSDALFAECIVPSDTPLSTVVEAVVDSSRYFAIRIVDRQSARHAVIGIGFRERTEASDFNAALFEHTQYLRRKKQAAEMHEAYTASANASEGTETVSQTDMSLKPGETISLKLTLNSAKTQSSASSSVGAVLPRLNSNTAKLQMKASSPGQIPLLTPPPAPTTAADSGSRQLSHALSGTNAQPSPGAVSSATHEPQATQSDRPSAALQQESAQDDSYQRGNPAAEDQGQQTRHEESTVPAQNDDWGDFVS